jgi:hypothetical protein
MSMATETIPDGWMVEVRLLDDPSLWCWEILDTVQGAVVASSWTGEWIAYESREEARAAGLRWLTGLRRPLTRATGRPGLAAREHPGLPAEERLAT